MKKLAHLRQHLIASVPALKRGPDRLLTFVEDSDIEFWRGEGLSHLYHFTARIIVTDYRGEADDIVIPVLEWLQVHEPGLNPANTVRCEAEILNNDTIDLALTVRLRERVIVTTDEHGQRVIRHVMPEPELQMNPDAKWELDAALAGTREQQP